jgi:hypothetical protein
MSVVSGRADLTVVPDLDRELDELYARPLGEFTGARNDLAKRLKKAGQTSEAERVGALAKPSVSAWAVNQLTRTAPDLLRKLLEAGGAMVEAQKAALEGKGTTPFDQAGRSQRDAVRELVPEAVRLLEGAGHRPSDALKERIATSLRAASMDPEGRRLLEQGRLEDDFESAGLGLLVGLAPTGVERVAAPPSADERREARLQEAREKAEAARAKADRLAEEAAQAEREAEEAKAAAARAAAGATALAKEAKAAAKEAEQAEKALARLG